MTEPNYKGFEITNDAMRKVYKEIEIMARNRKPCILFGPTGCGKEFLARYYHSVFSGNKKVPFFSVNCATLSSQLATAELAGYEKGAHSTATSAKEGLILKAKGGVVFLDEIGDTLKKVQAILLRMTDPENGEITPIGSHQYISTTDVTFIAATEKPEEKLRESLKKRFGVPIEVPGLDDRPEDIKPALEYFIPSAFLKRIDAKIVLKELFGVKKIRSFRLEGHDQNSYFSILKKDIEISEFFDQMTHKFADIAKDRSWPGNFRALKDVSDRSLLMVENTSEKDAFISNAIKYFNHYADRLKAYKKSTSTPPKSSISPKNKPLPLNRDMIAMIIVLGRNGCSHHEAEMIARFIYDRRTTFFERRDLGNILALKNYSSRTINNRIKSLENAGLINIYSASGKYQFVSPYKTSISSPTPPPIMRAPEIFSLSDDYEFPIGREDHIDYVIDLISRTSCIYITGKKGCGKTSFVKAVGDSVNGSYKVLYYHAGDKGIIKFLERLIRGIEYLGVEHQIKMPVTNENAIEIIQSLADIIPEIFNEEENPLLILDNCNRIEPEFLVTIVELWQGIKWIFVGRKNNQMQLETRFVDYQLEHFEYEASLSDTLPGQSTSQGIFSE